MKGTVDSLRERLDRLKDCFDQINHPAEARIAAALASSVDSERPVKIVVVGQFNSGKSTLVNALCGINVLPAGIIPTTATINIVEYSPTPTSLCLMSAGEEPIFPSRPIHFSSSQPAMVTRTACARYESVFRAFLQGFS